MQKDFKDFIRMWKMISEIPDEYDLFISNLNFENLILYLLKYTDKKIKFKTKVKWLYLTCYTNETTCGLYFKNKCIICEIFGSCAGIYDIIIKWALSTNIKRIKRDAVKIYKKLKEYEQGSKN